MRYIDNSPGGPRNPRDEALFPWLQHVLTPDVVGIRWQSGFFEARVLGVFSPTLLRLARQRLAAVVLIGSNDGETLVSAVRRLVDALGLPRPNASLGVVSYANGFYHPKTIHLCYEDGRQAAYVGSANLTPRGLSGLNVEAGLVLDTNEGDSPDVLCRIADSADQWFALSPGGLFEVRGHADVDRLQHDGILMIERAPRPPPSDGGQPGRRQLPRRPPGHQLPQVSDPTDEDDDDVEDEPQVEDSVLIAELVGPGRWSQAAFPVRFINNFFQVRADTGDVLHLFPVTQDGGVGQETTVPCRYKGSRNWYYELGLAVTLGEYPTEPPKPIGVFHRIAYQTCRYTILMPDNDSYAVVARCLEANLTNRRGRELRRTIVPVQVLRDAWLGNWFFPGS